MYGLGMQRGALFTLLADAWEGSAGLHRGTRVISVDHDTRRGCSTSMAAGMARSTW